MLRVISALFLSVVLALASVSMAVARGQAPMGGSIALCLDGVAVTVALDANGDPVSGAPHLCPDCLSAATAFDLPSAFALPMLLGRETRAGAVVSADLLPTAPVLAAHARGPPVLSV